MVFLRGDGRGVGAFGSVRCQRVDARGWTIGIRIPGAAKYFHPGIWITTGIFKDTVISIMATIGKQLITTVNNTEQV
jgi:hypothetical protein